LKAISIVRNDEKPCSGLFVMFCEKRMLLKFVLCFWIRMI